MTTTNEKIKTAFPGLHRANGVSEDRLEVINNPAAAQAAATETASSATDTVDANNGNNGGTDTATDATRINAPEVEAATEANTTDTQNNTSAAPAAINLDELSDEDFNKLLAKRTKGKIQSLEDLNPAPAKTKEQIEAEEAQRKQDALAWAFENNKLKREDYDRAIVDKSKSNRELALAVFKESLKAEGEKFSDEEMEELFKDTYHEGAEESSALYKQGQRSISQLADAYRKNNLSILDTYEPEYNEYLETQSAFKAYKKQVKAVSDNYPRFFDVEIPVTNADGTKGTMKHSVQVDAKVFDKVVSEVSHQNTFGVFNTLSGGKIPEDKLRDEIGYRLKAQLFDTVLPEMMRIHGEEREKALIVELGNKRHPGQTLNNGLQNTGAQGQQRQNTYEGLRKFHGVK